MSGKQIYILTEGGGNIGMGHISRCLSLAQAFQERGYPSTMIVNGEKLHAKVFGETAYIELDWINHAKELLSIVDQADIILIDSYFAPQEQYQQLASACQTIAFVDDEVRINYPEGVVVNGVMCAEKLNYPSEKKTGYLLGHRYSFLRKAFWNVPEKIIRQQIESVMIACGGNDAGLSYRIFKTLRTNYPAIQISVVLQNLQTPHLSFYESHATVLTNLNAEEMKQLMLDSDIAVTASGQTTYELCRTGTPFIAVTTVENQLFSIGCFYKNGLVQRPISLDDAELENKILDQFKQFSDQITRKNVSVKMKQTINGQGSLEVADHLLKTLHHSS